MGVCSKIALAVLALAVLLGTGVLPRLIAKVVPALVGFAPIFASEEELQAASYSDIPNGALDGKVCIVTGGNSGLGFVSVRVLAEKGCNVVNVGRRANAVEEACTKVNAAVKAAGSKGSCKAMIADFASIKSVRAFTKAFLAQYERLDVLMLNAGLVTLGGTELVADGIEKVFYVNHLASVGLLQDLQDIIVKTSRSSGDARIVVVSSAASFSASASLNVRTTFSKPDATGYIRDTYAQSKLCNILFAQELNKQFAQEKIFVNSLHPGFVATSIFAPLEELLKSGAERGEVLATVGLKTLEWVLSNVAFTPEDGARTQVWLAASPDVAKNKVRGKYFHPHATEVEPNPLVLGSSGEQLGVKLSKMSESMLKTIEASP